MTAQERSYLGLGDKIIDSLGKYGSGLIHEVIGTASVLGCATPSLQIFNPISKCRLALYPPHWSIIKCKMLDENKKLVEEIMGDD